MIARNLTLLGVACACLMVSCRGQSKYWTEPVATSGVTFGLAGGVAVVDDVDHRVVILTGTADQGLASQSFAIGHNFASAATSADGLTLFVLTTGDQPVQTKSDQLPQLTVIQFAPMTFQVQPKFPKVYQMAEPVSNLAIDPLGHYAVGYEGPGAAAAFAQNPNEIVIFDLTNDPAPQPTSLSQAAPNPVSRSIRSYGGTPQQLTFSPTLMLPANPAMTPGVEASARRLLLIETNLDVSIVDLTHAFDTPAVIADPYGRKEITVRLTSGTGTDSLSPTGLVIDPAEADGRIAFFTTGDSNVWSLQLVPSTATPPLNDFTPSINLTDVGSTPSAIQFVRTDSGLRVAALVPAMSSAMLVEPDTSVTTQVALPSPYSSMSLVTSVVNGPSSPTDVTLLWSAGSRASATGVALWALGNAVGQAYRSIEVLQIDAPIQAVLDVPAPNDNLKVLATAAGQGAGDFYVLDLVQRTANPIHTTSSPLLTIAPDGLRMWAYDQGFDLAQIDFTTLNPIPLTTETAIAAVYDIANPVGACPSGMPLCRSLVAINATGTLGATVFDALSPQATARQDVALLLEGP